MTTCLAPQAPQAPQAPMSEPTSPTSPDQSPPIPLPGSTPIERAGAGMEHKCGCGCGCVVLTQVAVCFLVSRAWQGVVDGAVLEGDARLTFTAG